MKAWRQRRPGSLPAGKNGNKKPAEMAGAVQEITLTLGPPLSTKVAQVSAQAGYRA
jgi:hypothetical protein